MADTHNAWTFWRGQWHEGNVRILGAASHATWLASLVFDGARHFDGVSPDLDLHCDRVGRSAEKMALQPMLTSEDIQGLVRDGMKKFAIGTDLYIRPMYWAENGDEGAVAPLPESTDFALCLEARPMLPQPGFTITTTRFRRASPDVAPTDAKAACLYPNNGRILLEARTKGHHNALVTDANGNVAELATANVFLVRDGEVFTPIPTGSFLAGITRQRVIALLRADGIKVNETSLRIEDFRTADEIFSSGNLSKIVPVTAFDDRRFASMKIASRARSLYWDWAHSSNHII